VVFLVTDDEFVKAKRARGDKLADLVYDLLDRRWCSDHRRDRDLAAPLLGLLNMVFIVIAAVKAAEGEVWSYPLTIDLL